MNPLWLLVVSLVTAALVLAKDHIHAYATGVWARVKKLSNAAPRKTAKKKPAAKSAATSGEAPESDKPKTTKSLIGGIVAGAALMWILSPGGSPMPTPDPVPIEGLDLRGKFVGPQAATDAAKLEGLCEELASIVEWDGMPSKDHPVPFITSGVAFDDCRMRLRVFMLEGDSIGDRQPKARDAIAAYLDEKCGNSGGPLTPAQRAKWVAAYRDIARAAEAAYR